MLDNIVHNPAVQDTLQKIMTDVALLVGSIVGVFLVQVAAAIRSSNLNVVQKMIAERAKPFKAKPH